MTQPPLAPLAPGWTEHRAPAGQPYWFNPTTNVSTYIRPQLQPPPPPGFHHPPQPLQPIHYAPGQAPPLITQPAPAHAPGVVKKEKREKPKDKKHVPGTDWVKVTTNKGNVFYTNKETKASLWTVPDEIKAEVEAMEKEANEAAAATAAAATATGANASGKKRKADEVDMTESAIVETGEAQTDDDLPEDEPEAVKDVPEASASPAPPSAPEPPAPIEPEPAAEVAALKPKKAKRKVVTEIEELEKDEDWQRRVAEEMAKEVEEQERAAVAKPEVVAPAVAAPTNGGVNRFEGTPEEAAAVFKVSRLVLRPAEQ